ncbi:hypothetical protein HGM15179_020640, partial [Zosterops borbonicus]
GNAGTSSRRVRTAFVWMSFISAHEMILFSLFDGNIWCLLGQNNNLIILRAHEMILFSLFDGNIWCLLGQNNNLIILRDKNWLSTRILHTEPSIYD